MSDPSEYFDRACGVIQKAEKLDCELGCNIKGLFRCTFCAELSLGSKAIWVVKMTFSFYKRNLQTGDVSFCTLRPGPRVQNDTSPVSFRGGFC